MGIFSIVMLIELPHRFGVQFVVTRTLLVGLAVWLIVFALRITRPFGRLGLLFFAALWWVLLSIFITSFAGLYVLFGVRAAANGGACLMDAGNIVTNKPDALYFTLTTFTTTGYGDIAPRGACRTIATVQMISGFGIVSVLLAVTLNSIFQASATLKADRQHGAEHPVGGSVGGH